MLPDDPPRPQEASDFPAQGPNSLASVRQRGVARSIDLALELLPLAIILTSYVDIEAGKLRDVPLWLNFLTIGVAVVYETLFVAWRGQTIGKMLLRIRVARLINGSKPDLSQVGLRALVPATAWVMPLIGFALYLGVFLSATLHPLRRGAHDVAAGTVVVRTR